MSEDPDTSETGDEPQASAGVGSLLTYNRKLRSMFEEAKAEHRTESRELKKQIRDLETQLENHGEVVTAAEAKFQDQVRGWESERADWESRLAAAKAEFEKSQAEFADLQATLNKAESRGGSLDKLKHRLLEQTRNLRSELNEVKSQNESLTSERDSLKEERDALSNHAARIAALDSENAKLEAQLAEQTEAIEKARVYNEGAEARESDNARLSALAEEKTKAAESAQKLQEAAEAQAFESRKKLLELYTQEESKEMMKTSLTETRSRLEFAEKKIELLTRELKQSERNFEELQEKILHSSERDSLRMALSSLAKKRKTES